MLLNIKKILLFINLLKNRDNVTRKEVEAICNINRRSFYRYVNLLSEINIPIYYDRSKKGYTVTSKIDRNNQFETVNELVLQIISLLHLKSSLDNEFVKDINNLILKLKTLAKFNISEILKAYENKNGNILSGQDNNKLIVSIFMDLAISNNLSIYVKCCNQNELIAFDLPQILFNEHWILKDKKSNFTIPVDSILYVKIE